MLRETREINQKRKQEIESDGDEIQDDDEEEQEDHDERDGENVRHTLEKSREQEQRLEKSRAIGSRDLAHQREIGKKRSLMIQKVKVC